VIDDPTSVDANKLESDINWDFGQEAGVNEGLENGGEINWNIDLDESGADGAGHTNDSLLHEVPSNEQETGLGRFLVTEYRNLLLNDLFEVRIQPTSTLLTHKRLLGFGQNLVVL